ncbi:hypothetical protein JCM4914_05260 [Streptomyces platensis subsp. malvinus]
MRHGHLHGPLLFHAHSGDGCSPLGQNGSYRPVGGRSRWPQRGGPVRAGSRGPSVEGSRRAARLPDDVPAPALNAALRQPPPVGASSWNGTSGPATAPPACARHSSTWTPGAGTAPLPAPIPPYRICLNYVPQYGS